MVWNGDGTEFLTHRLDKLHDFVEDGECRFVLLRVKEKYRLIVIHDALINIVQRRRFIEAHLQKVASTNKIYAAIPQQA